VLNAVKESPFLDMRLLYSASMTKAFTFDAVWTKAVLSHVIKICKYSLNDLRLKANTESIPLKSNLASFYWIYSTGMLTAVEYPGANIDLLFIGIFRVLIRGRDLVNKERSIEAGN